MILSLFKIKIIIKKKLKCILHNVISTKMKIVDMIKDMDIIPNDIIDYVLLDYIVGDIKYWKMKFDKCINAINELSSLYVKERLSYFEGSQEVDMVLVIQFFCLENFNRRDTYDKSELWICYRNNVIKLPRLRNGIVYMKYDANVDYGYDDDDDYEGDEGNEGEDDDDDDDGDDDGLI